MGAGKIRRRLHSSSRIALARRFARSGSPEAREQQEQILRLFSAQRLVR
jgi:hypothetical protein